MFVSIEISSIFCDCMIVKLLIQTVILAGQGLYGLHSSTRLTCSTLSKVFGQPSVAFLNACSTKFPAKSKGGKASICRNRKGLGQGFLGFHCLNYITFHQQNHLWICNVQNTKSTPLAQLQSDAISTSKKSKFFRGKPFVLADGVIGHGCRGCRRAKHQQVPRVEYRCDVCLAHGFQTWKQKIATSMAYFEWRVQLFGPSWRKTTSASAGKNVFYMFKMFYNVLLYVPSKQHTENVQETRFNEKLKYRNSNNPWMDLWSSPAYCRIHTYDSMFFFL